MGHPCWSAGRLWRLPGRGGRGVPLRGAVSVLGLTTGTPSTPCMQPCSSLSLAVGIHHQQLPRPVLQENLPAAQSWPGWAGFPSPHQRGDFLSLGAGPRPLLCSHRSPGAHSDGTQHLCALAYAEPLPGKPSLGSVSGADSRAQWGRRPGCCAGNTRCLASAALASTLSVGPAWVHLTPYLPFFFFFC